MNSPGYKVLSNIEITPDLVMTKLNALNPNKSPSQDKWHPYFLKELSETTCTPLSILFTKSLKEEPMNLPAKPLLLQFTKKDEKFNGKLSIDKYYLSCIKT